MGRSVVPKPTKGVKLWTKINSQSQRVRLIKLAVSLQLSSSHIWTHHLTKPTMLLTLLNIKSQVEAIWLMIWILSGYYQATMYIKSVQRIVNVWLKQTENKSPINAQTKCGPIFFFFYIQI